MYIASGTVDHFLCQRDHRDKTYDWKNFRYCLAAINSRKGRKRVLDPHEVGDGWFELHHPSLQLLLTSVVPANKRVLAQQTIEILGLVDSESVIKQRAGWLRMYLERSITLSGLQEMAPLLSDMVVRYKLQPTS